MRRVPEILQRYWYECWEGDMARQPWHWCHSIRNDDLDDEKESPPEVREHGPWRREEKRGRERREREGRGVKKVIGLRNLFQLIESRVELMLVEGVEVVHMRT
jgi:hypothetical protein